MSISLKELIERHAGGVRGTVILPSCLLCVCVCTHVCLCVCCACVCVTYVVSLCSVYGVCTHNVDVC